MGTGKKLFDWLFNIVALLILLIPVVSLTIGAIQTEASLFTNVKNPFPEEITFENFIVLITGKTEGLHFPVQVESFPIAFLNSSIVAIGTSFFTIFFGILSAYSLVRLDFKGREFYAVTILITRMVPLITLVIPLFLLFRNLKMLNTIHGLILAQTGFLLPFVIWLLKAYFETMPRELEEAARVDGCSRLGALFRVLIPIAVPGIASTFVITFLLTWNELLIPITIASREAVQTLPVLLSSFVSDYQLQYTIINATALLAMAPTVVLALLLQKYVVAGLTAGAVKG